MSDSSNKQYQSLSVVIPVSERHDNLTDLIAEYHEGLAGRYSNPQYLVVFDGEYPEGRKEVEAAHAKGFDITAIQLARKFGESIALEIGFEKATGDLILTAPAYRQVDAKQISQLFDDIDKNDMVIARRWPRTDSTLNQWTTRLFHWFIRLITGYTFRDMGCSIRLIKKPVIDEVRLYGDQHRFIPILVSHRGFSVKETSISQSDRESPIRVYGPGVYFRRFLDLITVFFLVRFTKKPLRFFGLIGGSLFMLGLIVLCVIVFQRLFLDVGLGDRPALVITTLMLVLGAQLIALGLVGELVIFTHSKTDKEYTVAEVINL